MELNSLTLISVSASGGRQSLTKNIRFPESEFSAVQIAAGIFSHQSRYLLEILNVGKSRMQKVKASGTQSHVKDQHTEVMSNLLQPNLTTCPSQVSKFTLEKNNKFNKFLQLNLLKNAQERNVPVTEETKTRPRVDLHA